MIKYQSRQVDVAVLNTVELFVCVGDNGEANQWSTNVLASWHLPWCDIALPGAFPAKDPKRTVDYEAFLNSGNEETGTESQG